MKKNHEIVAVNLLIITRMFLLMKDSRLDLKMFVAYLYGEQLSFELKGNQLVLSSNLVKKMEKAYRCYEAFIYHDYGRIGRVRGKLLEYGISSEFFDDKAAEYLLGEQIVINTFVNYLDNGRKSSLLLEDCKKILHEYIFTVKNKDGSLIVDCVRNMMLDMLSINKSDNGALYYLADELAHITPVTQLSRLSYKKYYNNILKNVDLIQPQKLPELPRSTYSSRVGNPLEKHQKTYRWQNIQLSLFIIRESYRVFAEVDQIPDALDKFYAELGISENEYDKMLLDYEQIDNRKLGVIFTKYKYPASVFHAEKPSRIKLCSMINELLQEYFDSKTGRYCMQEMIEDDDLYDKFKFYLLYRMDSDNYEITIATMSLLAAINGK